MRSLFALLALVLSAGSAQAYSHSFVNKSPVTVHFWVNYVMCSNDSWDVKPGETITWRSGMCCMKTPQARIGETAAGVQLEAARLAGWIAGSVATGGFNLFDLTYCGNTNWRLGTDAKGKPEIQQL